MNTAFLALALRSTALLAAGWCLTIVFRKGSASSRNAVWRSTLFGLLLLPVFFVRLPTWDVPVEKVPIVSRAVEYVQPPQIQRSLSSEIKTVLPAASTASQTPGNTSLIPEKQPVDWAGIFLFCWLACSTTALCPLLLGLFALVRTIRRSRPCELPQFASLCSELGIRKRVALQVADDLRTPSTAGFFRPVVLIPSAALEWDEKTLDMVFRHELAHIQRSDWLARIIAHLACVFYAPNPIVWIAGSKLRAESEAACDDLVVAGGVNAREYANQLLEIARGVRSSPLGLATVGMAHRSNVESRLRAIVDPRRRRGTLSRRGFASLALCILLAAGLIASFRFVVVCQEKPGHSAKTKDKSLYSFIHGIRDDVPDHPVIPRIAHGAKYSTDTYKPSTTQVTIARDGVASLPNGAIIRLHGIAPTETRDPIWDCNNKAVKDVENYSSAYSTVFGDGTYVEALDRNLYFTIDSQRSAIASTMGYIVSPEPPESYVVKGVHYAGSSKDTKSNSFELGTESNHTVKVWIPGPPKVRHITYRVGVAVGDWKTVLDVPNPYNGPAKRNEISRAVMGGGVTLDGIPCIIGPLAKEKTSPPNYRFMGDVNSSDLVARRALVLDAKGNLIRGEASHMVGWYPLSYEEIRRCAHVVIQEREFQWAEFRDLPLRPNLELDAKKAAGSLLTGVAQGIAPGFEANIPNLGHVAIASIVTPRRQGSTWTYSGQPNWRADGKVLATPSISEGPGGLTFTTSNDPPTEINLKFSGSSWHQASTRVRVGNEPLTTRPLMSELPWKVTRCFDSAVKEVTVTIDIADGPWQTLSVARIDEKPLPAKNPNSNDQMKVGLQLTQGVKPGLVKMGNSHDSIFFVPQPETRSQAQSMDLAYRYVAVLRNGTEKQLASRPTLFIPGRRGEDLVEESFEQLTGRKGIVASDIKEIKFQSRPSNHVIKFDHVKLKPKP